MIRRAEEKDIDKVMKLLSEVLEVHVKIRPDIFISKTTKYSEEELKIKFKDDQQPIFVAVNDTDEVIGYAFCVFKTQPFSENMIQFKSLYIDDLCVDASTRGQGIGKQLLDYVCDYAKQQGCYEVTLAVWQGNDSARQFYDNAGFKPKETIMETIL